MNNWLLGFATLVGAAAILFLADRLALHLEAKGYLFYRHKKPTSSAATSCVALQQFIEPSAREIVEVSDEQVAGIADETGDAGKKSGRFPAPRVDNPADFAINSQKSIHRPQ